MLVWKTPIGEVLKTLYYDRVVRVLSGGTGLWPKLSFFSATAPGDSVHGRGRAVVDCAGDAVPPAQQGHSACREPSSFYVYGDSCYGLFPPLGMTSVISVVVVVVARRHRASVVGVADSS